MKPLTSILCATDFSVPSRHAAGRAALLSAASGSPMTLMHILEKRALDELKHFFLEDASDVSERLRTQARENLDGMAAEIGAPLGIAMSTRMEEGTVLETIATLADGMDAGLLVLGAHGASPIRHWLLGATAERLLRKTRRPVLAVRQKPHEMYRVALVPVDFSDWSLNAIHLTRALAPKARLCLMHAYQVPFEGNLRLAGVDEERIQHHRRQAESEARDRLHALAEAAGCAPGSYRAIVIHGDAAPRILEQEEQQDAELLVLGKHGSGFTEELLLGSTTKHVLAESGCDVLITQN